MQPGMKQMRARSARAAATMMTTTADDDAVDFDLGYHEAPSQPVCPYFFVQLVANPAQWRLAVSLTKPSRRRLLSRFATCAPNIIICLAHTVQ